MPGRRGPHSDPPDDSPTPGGDRAAAARRHLARAGFAGLGLLLVASVAAGVYLRFDNVTLVGIGGSDTVYYTNIARAWSEGEFIAHIGDRPPVWRPVSFALFAGAIRTLGFHDWTLKAFNAGLDLLNIGWVFLLVYFLGRRDPWLSAVAAAGYALLPSAVMLARIELVHVHSAFFLAGGALAFVVGLESPRRLLAMTLSGLGLGLAALTHEELVLCAPGFVAVLVWDRVQRDGRSGAPAALAETTAFAMPVALVSLSIVLMTQQVVSSLGATATGVSLAEQVSGYLLRFARFSWNGVVGVSSVPVGWAWLLLMCALGVAGLWRTGPLARAFAWARPVHYLPFAVTASYLAGYAFFFHQVLFERTFLPLFVLLAVGLLVWGDQLLAQRLSRAASRALLLAVVVGLIPFHLDQFRYFFGPRTRIWNAGALPTGFDPKVGFLRLYDTTRVVQWPRRLHDLLGEEVHEGARMLVATSTMYAYPGRRTLQLDYYFGDDAIFVVDHEEPLAELVEKYRIKYLVQANFKRDERMLGIEEFQPYLYGGRYGEPRPLRLGAPYGFEPGEYTAEAEVLYIHDFASSRGAEMSTNGRDTVIYRF